MAYARVELVVAVSENDVIGRANQLPWRLPADLRHFKALTLGKPILMGRKTYESIGKALSGRNNIVLSRSVDFAPADCSVVATLQDAQAAAAAVIGTGACSGGSTGLPLMVIGGAEVYRQCLPLAERIHLTLVHTDVADGDTLFAGWRGEEWLESGRERFEADEKNAYAYSFVTLDRR